MMNKIIKFTFKATYLFVVLHRIIEVIWSWMGTRDRYLDISGKNKAKFISKVSLVIRTRTMSVSLITKSIVPQNLHSSFLTGIPGPDNRNNV